VAGQEARIGAAVQALRGAGVRVSLFIDPDTRQIEAAKNAGAPVIELHTGTYCRAASEGDGSSLTRELNRLIDGAKAGAQAGLEVHAGHGLDYANVVAVAAIPEIVELNIGHYLVGEALFVGLAESVSRMRKLMDGARETLRHSDTEAKVGSTR
jgi:pyridoxine 5-phosphate synthase